MKPEQARALVAADALTDAWLAGSATFWERRAQQLEAARPRRGDYPGRNETAADAAARHQRLTEAAAACRARATGADGWAAQAFADTFDSIARGAAA